MTVACDRLFCLTLGHEYSQRRYSLEGGDDEVLRLPVPGLLVHSPDGWFLLDTGFNPEFCRSSDLTRLMYAVGDPDLPGPGDPLLDALAVCGVRPSELAGVALSHLHADHAGGLPQLGDRLPVWVQRRELEFALRRATVAEAYWRPDYDRPGLDWRVVDGDTSIARGIDGVFTPGHTPGHMSYRVTMRDSGTWLFAMDAIDLQAGIDLDRTVVWSADPADAPKRRQSHDRLVRLAAEEHAQLVPGHCPVTWPRRVAPPGAYS